MFEMLVFYFIHLSFSFALFQIMRSSTTRIFPHSQTTGSSVLGVIAAFDHVFAGESERPREVSEQSKRRRRNSMRRRPSSRVLHRAASAVVR